MIRLIASCVWIGAVTLTSAYVGATFFRSGADQTAAKPQRIEGLEHRRRSRSASR